MSKKTDIQWCDSTVNPTMGCDGCELWNPKTGVRKCYAGMLHTRWPNHPGFAKDFLVPEEFPGRMKEAAEWPDLNGKERAENPWLNGLPRLIFVGDMGDSLSKSISFDYLKDEVIVHVISQKGQRHHWLWLTKQPQRMAKFSKWLADQGIEWPANLWCGTSVTAQATTSRIAQLLRVGNGSTTRFLSVEPQWEALDLFPWLSKLNWIIQGGQSGKRDKPFDIAWAGDMLRQCRRAGVAYFLKQLGSAVVDNGVPVSLKDGHGGDWSEWPEDIRVREFPITGQAAGKKALLSKDPKMVEAGKKAWETRRKNAERGEPLFSLPVLEIPVQPKPPWSVLRKVKALADEVGGLDVLAEMVETLKELRR